VDAAGAEQGSTSVEEDEVVVDDSSRAFNTDTGLELEPCASQSRRPEEESTSSFSAHKYGDFSLNKRLARGASVELTGSPGERCFLRRRNGVEAHQPGHDPGAEEVMGA
jgi:hypothetical protein